MEINKSLKTVLKRMRLSGMLHTMPDRIAPTNNHSESFAILFSIGTRILVWSDYCSGD